MLIPRALNAAAVLAALTMSLGAGSVNAQAPSSKKNPTTDIPLEIVIIGGPADHHQTICGLDVVKGVSEVACSNGETVRYFPYAPITEVWGRPPALVKFTKSRGKCPRGFRQHKDETGTAWCMNSEGRSFTPENARMVAHELALAKK